MIAWIIIAIRNLFRNPRRSLATMASVALGYAAINIFGGFTVYVFTSLANGYIYAEGSGHLSIFKKGFLTEGQFDPGKYLLTQEDVAAVRRACSQDSRIVIATPKLNFNGMISNGKASTIAIALGVIPADVASIRARARGNLGKVKFFSGRALEDSSETSVGLSTGLAQKLKLEMDSDAMLTGATIEGQMNALDVRVAQTFNIGSDVLNDKVMVCPLGLAQAMLDTTSVDRMGVLLEHTEDTEAVRESLSRALAERDLEIQSYVVLSPLYRQVKEMFVVIFVIMFIIVMAIVLMSVVNTIGMAVVERTQEIGTLRALGLKKHGIIRLFALESAALGVAGSLAGFILTMLIIWLIETGAPTWVPPGVAVRVPLEVYFVPDYLTITFVCFVFFSIVAAVFPARRAARQNIIAALGHV